MHTTIHYYLLFLIIFVNFFKIPTGECVGDVGNRDDNSGGPGQGLISNGRKEGKGVEGEEFF